MVDLDRWKHEDSVKEPGWARPVNTMEWGGADLGLDLVEAIRDGDTLPLEHRGHSFLTSYSPWPRPDVNDAEG